MKLLFFSRSMLLSKCPYQINSTSKGFLSKWKKITQPLPNWYAFMYKNCYLYFSISILTRKKVSYILQSMGFNQLCLCVFFLGESFWRVLIFWIWIFFYFISRDFYAAALLARSLLQKILNLIGTNRVE